MSKPLGAYYVMGLTLVAAQLFGGFPLIAAAGTPRYENSFNKGWGNVEFQGTPTIPESCESTKFSLADPLGGSNVAAKIYQQGGSECLAAGELKHRAEFALLHPQGLSVDGSKTLKYDWHVDYWVGFRLYNDSSNSAYWSYLGSSGKSVCDPLTIVRGNHRETALRYSSPNGQPHIKLQRRWRKPDGKINFADAQDFPIQYGWNDIVVHFRREWTNDGIIELWINGAKVTSDSRWANVRTASDPGVWPTLPQSKLGIYWTQEDSPSDFLMYFDDIKVAEGASGENLYSLVSPSSSQGNVQMEPSAPTGLALTVE
jgi:hypothetical protein